MPLTPLQEAIVAICADVCGNDEVVGDLYFSPHKIKSIIEF